MAVVVLADRDHLGFKGICSTGKFGFVSKNAASRAAAEVSRRAGGDHGKAYHCKDCNQFHFGRLWKGHPADKAARSAMRAEVMESDVLDLLTRNKMTAPATTTLSIRSGPMSVSPELAERILLDCRYDRQRKLKQIDIEKLREAANRDLWLDSSQIAFCRLNGKLTMVNGYHRLTMLSTYHRPLPFNLVFHDVKSDEEIDSYYARYDTLGRARSTGDAVQAYDLAREFDVPKQVMDGTFKAIQYIRAGMLPEQRWTQADRVSFALRDDVMTSLRDFKVQIIAYSECLTKAEPHIKRKLLSGSIIAVALLTLRDRLQPGMEFWRGLAENDGLRVGDPRRALFNYLLGNSFTGSSSESMLVSAQAWNAYYGGSSLKAIARPSTNRALRISGVKFKQRDA